MSVDLAWSDLDEDLSCAIVSFLNRAFTATPLPSFLGDITVTSFSFGDINPDITLVDIRDVYRDFTEEDNQDEEHLAAQRFMEAAAAQQQQQTRASNYSHTEATVDEAAANKTKDIPSLQMHVRANYSGNLRIALQTSLLINYPAPLFMTLPLSLAITGLAFNGVFVVAFEGDKRKIHVSLLDHSADDNADNNPDDSSVTEGGKRPAERLLTGLVLESVIGQSDKHVLVNVGKVERFVLEVARSALEVSRRAQWRLIVGYHC